MSRISTALARVLAVLALAAVALAIFLVISSSLEDSDSDNKEPAVQRQGQNNNNGNNGGNGNQGQNNPPKFYVVQPGDSLSLIAEKTGVSLERLQQLNPDIDPQLLPSGVKLRLR